VKNRKWTGVEVPFVIEVETYDDAKLDPWIGGGKDIPETVRTEIKRLWPAEDLERWFLLKFDVTSDGYYDDGDWETPPSSTDDRSVSGIKVHPEFATGGYSKIGKPLSRPCVDALATLYAAEIDAETLPERDEE
jgi:hypothetical protein